MDKTKPIILIIFGITGDLAVRKLLPAINEIISAGVLPEHFQIVGVTRKADVDIEKLFIKVKNSDDLKKCITIFKMDLDDQAEYGHLEEKLNEIENTFGLPAERLFYLSV